MSRYVAFLRGMNLGGRRIKNVELCSHFEALGLTHVSAFLASGNIVFDAGKASAGGIGRRIEDGLRRALDYEVPTFVRTADEVTEIAAYQPFTPKQLEKTSGRIQVAMFSDVPDAASRKAVLKLSTTQDRLALHGRELFWLPAGNLLDSELDLGFIEATLGPVTIRTKRTLERIAAKYFDD